MAGWTSPEFVLPNTRAFASAAVWKNWLVVAGGSVEVSDPVTTYRKNVIAARIGPNGQLGMWKTIAVLPEGRVGCSLWISPTGKMYIFGGAPLEADPTAAMIDSGRDVLIGQLNADGDLQGPGLVSERSMPHSLVNTGVAFSRDFLYMVGGSNRRLSLAFKDQTGNFTIGDTITGKTSGATAVLHSQTDSGATGTLNLSTVVGTFANDEVIEDQHFGSAVVNGTLGTTVFLDYDAQTINFVVTDVVVGRTSGASGTIGADADGGTDGTLTLTGVSGTFANNEKVAVRMAKADGTLGASYLLDYDAQSKNFATSDVLHGVTNGAVAIVDSDVDGGAAGTLTISSVVGDFADNEKISVQMADSNGGLSPSVSDSYYLDFDTGTAAFHVGHTVTGAGGATGVVFADSSGGVGATGTLTLTSVVGDFVDGEAITCPGAPGGAAKVAAGTVKYKTLPYDDQRKNFTAADAIQSLISGGTAVVMSDTDGGTTGTLKVKTVVGTFPNNERIVMLQADADGTQYKLLTFKDQTKNFTVAQTIRGATSLASAVLQGQTDGGATGTLKMKTISGAFSDSEYLLVDHADANGTQFKALGYDGQTGNFSVGDTVTGVTSAAKLTIVTHTDSGATGVMAGDSVVGGPFVGDEDIQGALAGGAVVNTIAMTSVYNPSVYRARVFADGSLGVWESIGVLPAAVSVGPVSIVAQGENLYWQSSTELYWAKATGERLDAWQSVSAAADLAGVGIAAVGDKLLVVGGDASGEVASVYVMPVNSQGPNGQWYQTAAIPVALKSFGLAVQGDRLWVCGGISTTAQAGVVTAQLSPDGRIAAEKNSI
jgi:hypothetical protein